MTWTPEKHGEMVAEVFVEQMNRRKVSIATRIKRAQKKIADGYAELRAAQDDCPHPGLQGKYGSNTGNWCSGDDSYWLDLRCPCCDKRWTIDSEDERYRLYGNQRWQKYSCEIVREWK